CGGIAGSGQCARLCRQNNVCLFIPDSSGDHSWLCPCRYFDCKRFSYTKNLSKAEIALKFQNLAQSMKKSSIKLSNCVFLLILVYKNAISLYDVPLKNRMDQFT